LNKGFHKDIHPKIQNSNSLFDEKMLNVVLLQLSCYYCCFIAVQFCVLREIFGTETQMFMVFSLISSINDYNNNNNNNNGKITVGGFYSSLFLSLLYTFFAAWCCVVMELYFTTLSVITS
jgi:hypothetical protein